jgi:hypothetical protein
VQEEIAQCTTERCETICKLSEGGQGEFLQDLHSL